jgi:hypothetical protein
LEHYCGANYGFAAKPLSATINKGIYNIFSGDIIMANKKGQSAMEYMMTYGWAILIIIVVVGALYAMGVFSPSSSTVACSPCFTDFAYVDYSGGTLVLTNGARQVNITAVTASPDTGSAVTSTALGVNTAAGTDVTITNVDTTGNVGLTVTYTVTESGLSHTDTGTIRN